MHRVVCGKVQKMKGGTLNETTRSLDINDFSVIFQKIENVPFLKLQTFGKLGTLGFGSTKEQYGFFNPKQPNDSQIYYQYVVIRKKDKNVVFRELKDNTISEPFDISKSKIDTPILLKLLNAIKKKIQNERTKNKGFDAKSIVETLEKYLKNKISTNLNNDELSIKLFEIEETNPPEIKYFSFGERTSKLFGNKTQYIFFNIVELSGKKYYKYVVIRDKNQKISLKKLVIDENNNLSITNLNSFSNIQSDKSIEGQLILEKLQFDIRKLINGNNPSERSNFATTIRKELGKYIDFGKNTDKNNDIKFTVDNFTVDDVNEYYFKIKDINDNIYIFFNDLQIKNEMRDKGENEILRKYEKFYMYVMFLDKKQKIDFKKLIFYKENNPIILKFSTSNYNLLEYLYEKINSVCDSDNGEENNKNILNILYSLEKYLYIDRSYLKSRDFYITYKQQNETIRIVNKDNKTLIFFKRYKKDNINFILYEYVIIIDDINIKFKRNPGSFILVRDIEDITIDDIDELLLMLLYEELLKFYDNIKNNTNNSLKKHLKKLIFNVLLNYKEIEKLYNLKKKVENVLTSHIKNNKISVNGKDHNIQYNGEFTFDFFDNLKGSNKIIRLKEFLQRILAKENINMINNKRFKFKPIINSIKKKSNNEIITINKINLLNIAAPIINGNNLTV
jgi:hypothetical protein